MAEKTYENINATARSFYDKAKGALERANLEYAISLFLETLRVEPNFTKARQLLRAAQVKNTETAKGLKKLFSSAKSAPALARAKMVAQKNPTEAMDLAEQALTEDPRNGAALMMLAEAAETGQHFETTAQTLEYYLRLAPRDTKAMHWLARTYLTLGMNDAARERYEQLIQINPNDFAAQKGLKDATAHGAMASGGWEEAKSYRDVLKDEKESVALEQAAKVVRAEDHLQNLINESLAKLKNDPGSPVIQRELGNLYRQHGDFDKALEYLQRIYDAEAGADPSLEREMTEVKTKRIEAAIAARKEKLRAGPADTEALQTEIANLEKELVGHMLAEAEKLVERYPNDLNYRFDLALLYFKNDNQQGAIEQFQKAVGHPQKRVASLNYLGQCFHQLGLHDLAADQYRKALDELPMMDGVKKEITYNLGLTLEAMGHFDQAVAEYKKIAAVDFGFRDVRQRITQKPPPKPA
jgi:tetratricopeptide (TPR) repeat protein